jgi:aryl-alcohol dehydrogenase-like predicted oxidoreductase
MEYRRLGRAGLKVSELCLGTMTFGHGTDEAEAQRIVGTALDAGVMFFDTADGYNLGASEVMLGKALGARRRDAVIATKVFNPMGPGPNDSGMSRRHIVQAVEGSLRRLGTDCIDLYYIHHVDVQTPLEEMLRAFDDLVRQGKVLYTGCSNYETWRLMEAIWLSDHNGWARFEGYQPQYNLLVRDIEEELVPACELKGLGIVAWAPLAGGYLSGKYKPGQASMAGTRSAENWSFPSRFFHPDKDKILAELLAVASEIGRSAAQVAVRWVLDQPQVTSAIIGARTAAQLADTLKAGGWRLPDAVLKRLDAVSALPPRFPRLMEASMKARRDDSVRMPPHPNER